MRVALLLLEDFPGSDNRVQRQVKALRSAGHDVRIFCARSSSTEHSWSGASISRSLLRRKKSASMKGRLVEYVIFPVEAMVWLIRQSLTWRPDAIHVANMPDWLVFSALPLRIVHHCRIVLDLHDLMPDLMDSKRSGSRIRPMLERLERRSVRFADGVITTSPGFVNTLERRTGQRAILIPNGVDPDVFPWRDISMEEYVSFPKRIVYHGTIAERFGVGTLVDAVALLSGRYDDLTVDIYGDGDALLDIRSYATNRRVDGVIRFHGQVPSRRLADLLRGARVGVVPYARSDFMSMAFSTKAFEYAALGIPVIAADLPSLREQLGEWALYFEPDDAESLASALTHAIENAEHSWQLARGAQSFTRKYAWEAWAESYVDTITSACHTPTGQT